MVTNYDKDPDWKEELGDSAWFVYDDKQELDKVKSFAKFLAVRGYYLRYSALQERLYVTRYGADTVLQEELSPDIFLQTVLQKYGCFRGLKEKECKAMERLVDSLPIVSRVFADPRYDTGLVQPDGWTSWAMNIWKHPVRTTDTKFDDPAVQDAVNAVLELIDRLLPVAEEREQVVCWIAHAVQKPWERPQWHLLLRGEGGNGKSTFFIKILRAIFGTTHVNEQEDITRLEDPTVVSGWLRSLFVVCDDFEVQRRVLADKLKHLMTAAIMESRRLYQNATQEEVFSRFIFISNKHQPMKFDTSDRRFFVPQFMDHLVDEDDSAAFVKQKILSLLDEWGRFKDVRVHDALLDYLQTYPLDNFNPGVPLKTKDHQRMCGSSGSIIEAQIQGFIDSYPVATYKSFRAYMEAEHQTHVGDVERNIWEKKLREAGGWVQVATGIKAQHKARLSRPVGNLQKGKSFTGWCLESFLQQFTDSMEQLFQDDEAYFETLFPRKS
ncbi:TPA: hypothetical protein LAL36_004345 [Escherichia coli]|nr:hypothetical protein [Escherichia coli]